MIMYDVLFLNKNTHHTERIQFVADNIHQVSRKIREFRKENPEYLFVKIDNEVSI